LKYLIAGLGNIGPEYANTRHNIGFNILDALAGASNIFFEDRRYGFVAEYRHKGRIMHLLKPTTFVNLSGKAVNYWLKKHGIPVSNLLVIADDIALPFATIRLRPSGSDGGHNGLRNIIEVLGENNFARLRFGIGNDYSYGSQVEYVLGEWSEGEKAVLKEKIPLCADIIRSFATSGIEFTMNNFNNK
jgi:peptidyl-tRNA hydrolase, PTH1 family